MAKKKIKNKTIGAKSDIGVPAPTALSPSADPEVAKEAAFRERLALLAQEHTIRGISRRTAFPHPNISRYIKKGLSGATFCRRVVERMGVNPSWLLTGEGSAMLADVPAVASETASGLLEVVGAMNAVSRMRLGALAGKDHLKVLRELNDALSRHEELRKKLNSHSESIFREILKNIRDTLTKDRDPDKAQALIKAGEQIARLCDNPDLYTEYQRVRAHYEHLRLNDQDATAPLREVVARGLIRSHRADAQFMFDAQSLIATLYRQHRMREAKTYTEMALLLGDGLDHGSTPYLLVFQFAAILNFELGDIFLAREQFMRANAHIGEDGRKRAVTPWMAIVDFYAGAVTYQQARTFCGSLPEPYYLAALAMWSEDERDLKDNLKLLNAYDGPTPSVASIFAAAIEGLLAAKQGENASDTLARFDQRVATIGDATIARGRAASVIRACIAHLCGDNDAALKLTTETGALLESLKPNIELPLVFGSLHYRNVLRCAAAPPETRARAKAFFEQHIAAGYAAFRTALEPAKKS